jgi:tRNA 2-thiocytidine biosynthesis protein TtcA
VQIKAMMREWERQYPGRTDNMLHAMGHVVPSHLMDARLHPFTTLRASGVPDPGGDKAFDDDEACASPSDARPIRLELD